MGCDFSHGDLRMSYSAFSSLRRRLAESARIDLARMEGYGGTRPWTAVKDPLQPFLAAMDEYGGGEITPQQCLSVKRRIEELAVQWPDMDRDWRELALKLARGMAEASVMGETFYWF